jgi:pyridoxamine 5'-phosphate oxidase-like protein
VPRLRTELLTEDLYRRLRGADIASRASHAIVVCTVDVGGWPHPAMLSYFEVAAHDRHNLRLAVYNNSRTCANMRERGKATLVIVDAGLVCYVSGAANELVPAMRDAPYNAKLNLRIEQVLFDEPPPDLEPGVQVTSGIMYSPRTVEGLARAHAVLAELLEE